LKHDVFQCFQGSGTSSSTGRPDGWLIDKEEKRADASSALFRGKPKGLQDQVVLGILSGAVPPAQVVETKAPLGVCTVATPPAWVGFVTTVYPDIFLLLAPGLAASPQALTGTGGA
jgi:hypothetical protein